MAVNNMQGIPVQYVEQHRQVSENDIRPETISKFRSEHEAREYIRTNGGVLIHDQNGSWYAFPKEIEGKVEVVSYKEE